MMVTIRLFAEPTFDDGDDSDDDDGDDDDALKYTRWEYLNNGKGGSVSMSSIDDYDDGGGYDDADGGYRIIKCLHLIPSSLCPSHPQGCALVLRLLLNMV